jgi:hypothetical protein
VRGAEFTTKAAALQGVIHQKSRLQVKRDSFNLVVVLVSASPPPLPFSRNTQYYRES